LTVKSADKLSRFALMAIAAILLLSSVLLTGPGIESALVSDPARKLGWGTALFRVMLAVHGVIFAAAGLLIGRLRSSADPAPEPPIPSRSMAVLTVMSLAGLALRLFRLNTDLWHDEVLTLVDFVRLPMGDIVTLFPAQNQHMLYSVLGRISFDLFGESAWALRLPSVLFGIASIWALYLLGRRLIGETESLLACTLMTLSYHHIWFSQNARGYMGLLFFTLLSTWIWLRALDGNRWLDWIGYALAIALGAWLHLTMAFVAATHVLLTLPVLLGSGKSGSTFRALVSWLLCCTLTLQLHALALPDFLATGLHEVSLPSEWTNPLWVVTESLRSLKIGFSGAAVLLAGAAMLAIGWLSIARRDLRAALSLILPAIISGGTMLVLGHNLWPRFFFFSMGFALLIVIAGSVELPRLARSIAARMTGSPVLNEKVVRNLGFALAGLVIIASVTTIPRNYRLPKQDFTGAMQFIDSGRKPGDAVVSVGLAAMDYGRYYAPNWLIANDGKELEALRDSSSRTWLVYTLPIQLRAYHPEIWEITQRDYDVVKVFPGTLGGGEVYVCKSK